SESAGEEPLAADRRHHAGGLNAELGGKQLVKLQRYSVLAGLTLTATLALTACGSDNNSSPSTPSGSGGGAAISCATGSLNAQGSTAQANAVNQWIKDFQTAC